MTEHRNGDAATHDELEEQAKNKTREAHARMGSVPPWNDPGRYDWWEETHRVLRDATEAVEELRRSFDARSDGP